MESKNKPRIIKDYEKLSEELKEQIKLEYSEGFSTSLISFTNKNGERVSALPFETEDYYYLIKMSVSKAQKIVDDDDDYDDDGMLKDDIKEEYEDKYSEDEVIEDEPNDDYDD
jgi:hypothetical protein